jgi:hypothetical protein
LKQTLAKLEMSGSENSAVEILEKAVRKANNSNKPHEAYEIEMFLVEMLIYKVKKSHFSHYILLPFLFLKFKFNYTFDHL